MLWFFLPCVRDSGESSIWVCYPPENLEHLCPCCPSPIPRFLILTFLLGLFVEIVRFVRGTVLSEKVMMIITIRQKYA